MVQLFKASESLNIKEEIYIQTQKEAKEKVKLFSRIKRGEKYTPLTYERLDTLDSKLLFLSHYTQLTTDLDNLHTVKIFYQL